MTYKLDQIDGIGPFFAERLVRAGVSDSDALLERCATAEGRRQLSSYAAVSTQQLETWARQADLMRVSGIGGGFGHLLEASGVRSVEELSQRAPENIVNLLHRVNAERKITRAVPSLSTVATWVRRARDMQTAAAPKTAAPVTAVPSTASHAARGHVTPGTDMAGAQDRVTARVSTVGASLGDMSRPRGALVS